MKASIVTVAVVLGLASGILADENIRWIGKYDWAAVTKLNADVVFSCALTQDDNGTIIIVGQKNASTTIDHATIEWHMPGGASNETGTKRIDGEGRLHIHNVSMSDQGIYLCSVKTNCRMQDCNSTQLWFKHGLNLNGPIYTDLLEKYRMNLIIGSASAGGVLGFFLLACMIYKFRYKEDKDEPSEVDLYTGTKGGASASGQGSYTKDDEMSSRL